MNLRWLRYSMPRRTAARQGGEQKLIRASPAHPSQVQALLANRLGALDDGERGAIEPLLQLGELFPRAGADAELLLLRVREEGGVLQGCGQTRPQRCLAILRHAAQGEDGAA